MHFIPRASPVALILSALIASGCTIEASPPPESRPASEPPATRPPATRPEARWEKLAEMTVNGKADNDRLTLGRSEGAFSALQFKVERSAMKMRDIVITFTDGTSFSPDTKLVFEPGDTRTVDLPGNKRTIRAIDFKYGDMPGGGDAHLEVWGR